MKWRSFPLLVAAATLSVLAGHATATVSAPTPLAPVPAPHVLPAAAELAAAAPDADPRVLDHALQAMQCAAAGGMPASQRLAVIDYSLPSSTPRLWVFDLESRRLLFRELVAHGRNTGDKLARVFSNAVNSRSSSLGLFRTLDTYDGSNGYSLRLEGLEPGFNDRALERAIVMHGAPYVDDEHVRKFGRIGRSWGCPAVRLGVARRLIDTLKGGQFVFSYYPDSQWLAGSRYLNCGQRTASR
ncbi:MAG TPA: murein L,D-transpeptidase catalytic domain family protein [Moraxellaceae bacterium]|nr:murein L,D-transpeptidase catalytic domain family protein [Moraxellaceae bacterium]